MRRREFLGASIGWAASTGNGLARDGETRSIKRVLVVAKCHFDLGFVDTQAGVIKRYFQEYFPAAIRTARAQRETGQDRYVWTTGSWLLYEYLEQADGPTRRMAEDAVRAGDLAWHGLPYSWQTELLDRGMIAGLTGLSKALDRRFGVATSGAKMTDVPGHSRGLIGPLAENGITFLDVGVNSASTPPDVPELFVWRDGDGKSLVMMYHRKEYGGVVEVPGSDVAVAVEVRNDNSGPHTPGEIKKIFADLRARYPGAQVQGATLTDVAKVVEPRRAQLPAITAEIGDTWIYGVPSDPVKVARFRELQRLRKAWVTRGEFKTGDTTDIAFLRKLGLAAEHTWGTDTKTWLDFDHYKPDDLAAVMDEPKYQTVAQSWKEKRDNLDAATATLPVNLRQEAAARLTALQVVRPSYATLQEAKSGAATITGKFFTVALDGRTGAIKRFKDEGNGREWASEAHPLALCAYQALSKADYDHFLAAYVMSKEDWAPKDFGKPNIEHFGALSRTWLPRMVRVWTGQEQDGWRMVAELSMEDAAQEKSGLVAWPRRFFLEVMLPDSEAVANINVSWIGKRANRLPEALWLTFAPAAPERTGWTVEKVERAVATGDVVAGGNRVMHAVSGGGMQYRDVNGKMTIESLDAPVVAIGERTPLLVTRDELFKGEADPTRGLHFSLFNNAWGTNYRQWFSEDMRFRFRIRC